MQSLRALLLASGSLGLVIGMVKMLQSLDDPSTVGPATAVALLCPAYAFIFAEVLVAPLIRGVTAPMPEAIVSEHHGGYRDASGDADKSEDSASSAAVFGRVVLFLIGLAVFVAAMAFGGGRFGRSSACRPPCS